MMIDLSSKKYALALYEGFQFKIIILCAFGIVWLFGRGKCGQPVQFVYNPANA